MISIVIPARNEEAHIEQCLKSLKSQNYQGDYEVLVVDNDSKDKTSDIARSCGANVVNCPKVGTMHARQSGAIAARGDIVIQADADTVYPADWLSKINEHFKQQPELAGLTGAYHYLEPRYWSNTEYTLRAASNSIWLFIFNQPIFVSGANFAFRRDAFVKAGGYEINSLYPDQWGISNRISKVGKVIYDKNIVVFTSIRRVEKPFAVLLFDTLKNFN
jgi:peptidoglycan-N-acetylglucosamine deacetylase